MKLGVFNPLFSSLSLDDMLDKFVGLGLQTVEVATGGFVGNSHCNPEAMLADASARQAFADAFASRNLTISALSCHGNALHPDPEIGNAHHDAWTNTVKLAKELGVDTVVTFSGCPGGSAEDKVPNWHVCAWPTDHAKSLEWQWQERVLPYWQREAEFAEAHDVNIAIEMHPGFVVYNPEHVHYLRGETRSNMGVNFDPSHLFWQNIDIVQAIRYLGDTIYHFHAKDTHLDPVNLPIKGVLDTVPYDQVAKRSWVFRSVGYGHGVLEWKQIISALRTVGYDGAISIEHEDALASPDEGLQKAIATLKEALLFEPAGAAWWAD
ncbi:MAG: sugar phosphate isomerase/epimerase [Deinococcota bacterium]